MPLVGLGTWQVNSETFLLHFLQFIHVTVCHLSQSPKAEVKAAVNAALEAGYRHIDAAYNYLNEDAIGEVLHEWISSGRLSRSELFIVTKLPMIGNRAEDVEKFLKKSLASLQLDYVDLYLIHFPVGMIGKHDQDVFPVDAQGNFVLDMKTDLIGLWKAMEVQVDNGLAKSIGISNFNGEQIERIVGNARIKPANLQMELHAYCQQKPIREVCKKHAITVCAYAPLGSPGRRSKLSTLYAASLKIRNRFRPSVFLIICLLVQLWDINATF